MAQNPNITSQDYHQVVVRTFDSENDATRVAIAAATEFSIELDANDGDSVATKSLMLSKKSSINKTSYEQVIAEFSVEGYKDFQLMSKSAILAGEAQAHLQISPVDSGDMWLNTDCKLQLQGSSDKMSEISHVLAKRARVIIASNSISEGSAELFLMARG
jgi:hypothetical protein